MEDGGPRQSTHGGIPSGRCVSLFQALFPAGGEAMRSGATCSRSGQVLELASAPRRGMGGQQDPAVRRRLPPRLTLPSQLGTSFPQNGQPQSPESVEFHLPRIGSRAPSHSGGAGTGGSHPVPDEALRGLDRCVTEVAALGGEIRRRGSWSQAKSMHRYELSARLSADYQKYSSDQRTLFEQCEQYLAAFMLDHPHPLHLRLSLHEGANKGPSRPMGAPRGDHA